MKRCLTTALLCGLLETASAQEFNPVTFFQENCALCHTIGGGASLGPDLKDIHKSVDREWFVRFVMDPEASIGQGDARALAIQQEFGGIVMPTIEMSRAQAEAIFLWLEWESSRIAIERGEPQAEQLGGESAGTESPPVRSQLGEPALSTRELTPQDVALGKKLFQGEQPLSNGGPACISCHTISVSGGLGGGKLGPDLTGILARLGGRRGLEAWLRASPTTTMRIIFGQRPITPEEAVSLVAYFEQGKTSEPRGSSWGMLQFILFSGAGACILLLVMGLIWKDRLRGVRRAIVAGAKE
ncbi:MAG: c-type cytochrome [Acidobacteria bacterium]|nr:c-type cytochrome [Acidobacteriota bacterium]